MQSSSIKLRSIKVEDQLRLRVIVVASALSHDEQLMCQKLSGKNLVDLENWNTWNQFRKVKLCDKQLCVIILKQENQGFVQSIQHRPNLRLVLITSCIQESGRREELGEFSLIAQRVKEVFDYILRLIKGQNQVFKSNRRNQNIDIQSETNKSKLSDQQLQWEKRVFKVLGQNGLT